MSAVPATGWNVASGQRTSDGRNTDLHGLLYGHASRHQRRIGDESCFCDIWHVDDAIHVAQCQPDDYRDPVASDDGCKVNDGDDLFSGRNRAAVQLHRHQFWQYHAEVGDHYR